jgi:TolB protein
VAWEYQPERPDVDHFNRDYKPELARGGSEICRLDPRDGSCELLTRNQSGIWDFRAIESPDGRWIAFCRAATGDVPAIWVMKSDGSNPRQITRGWQDGGGDHPKWLSERRATGYSASRDDG